MYNLEKKVKAYQKLKSIIGFEDKYECTSNNNRIYKTNIPLLSISNEYINGRSCDEDGLIMLIFNNSFHKIISWHFVNEKTSQEIIDTINYFIKNGS